MAVRPAEGAHAFAGFQRQVEHRRRSATSIQAFQRRYSARVEVTRRFSDAFRRAFGWQGCPIGLGPAGRSREVTGGHGRPREDHGEVTSPWDRCGLPRGARPASQAGPLPAIPPSLASLPAAPLPMRCRRLAALLPAQARTNYRREVAAVTMQKEARRRAAEEELRRQRHAVRPHRQKV